MKLTLLRFAARRPLLALLVAVSLAVVAVAGAGGALSGGSGEVAPDANPRLVLGRVWFDAYPEKATDNVQIWIWLGGGVGLYETGSVWRSSMDFFEFERRGDRLDILFFQDKKRFETKLTVAACDEKPPFDLCLTLDDPPRGPKKYYAFGNDEDLARGIPWAVAVKRAAEARAAGR